MVDEELPRLLQVVKAKLFEVQREKWPRLDLVCFCTWGKHRSVATSTMLWMLLCRLYELDLAPPRTTLGITGLAAAVVGKPVPPAMTWAAEQRNKCWSSCRQSGPPFEDVRPGIFGLFSRKILRHTTMSRPDDRLEQTPEQTRAGTRAHESTAEQSRAEHTTPDQSTPDQSTADQSRPDQSRRTRAR